MYDASKYIWYTTHATTVQYTVLKIISQIKRNMKCILMLLNLNLTCQSGECKKHVFLSKLHALRILQWQGTFSNCSARI